MLQRGGAPTHCNSRRASAATRTQHSQKQVTTPQTPVVLKTNQQTQSTGSSVPSIPHGLGFLECVSVASFNMALCPLFPAGSDSEESAFGAGDLGSIPELGRSPGEGSG